VCEYFKRTWTPGFVEGSQCAVFSDPLFLVSEHGSVFPTLVEPVDVQVE
jgi:hypothetical protein